MRQPHWRSYKNAETIHFVHLVLQITSTYDLTALHLSEEVEPLSQSFTELKQLFGFPKKSLHTALLVKLDQERNKGLRAMKKAIDFNLLHFKTEKNLASQSIEAVFTRFGGTDMLDLNYSGKAATMRLFCRALLNDSALLEDLKLLDIEELVVYLSEKNESFEDTFLDRNREKLRVNSFQVVKTNLIYAYRVFIQTLEARAFLEQGLDYDLLIMEIHNLVIKFNKTTKQKTKTTTNPIPLSNQKETDLMISHRKEELSSKPDSETQVIEYPQLPTLLYNDKELNLRNHQVP